LQAHISSGIFQGLHVSVGGNEFNPPEIVFDHGIDSVSSTTTDADNPDPGQCFFCHSKFHLLSPFFLFVLTI
jgi:hypothetical protein